MGFHLQGVQLDRLGFCDAFGQIDFPKFVHQKADSSTVHAIDRNLATHITVQAFEHEAVAAKGNNDVCLVRRDMAVTVFQPIHRILGDFGFGCDKGDGIRLHLLPDG